MRGLVLQGPIFKTWDFTKPSLQAAVHPSLASLMAYRR